MTGIPGGAIPLGRTTQVQITDQRIVMPNDVAVLPGGMVFDPCICTLRVIELSRQRAYYAPLTQQQVEALASMCIAIASTGDNNGR